MQSRHECSLARLQSQSRPFSCKKRYQRLLFTADTALSVDIRFKAGRWMNQMAELDAFVPKSYGDVNVQHSCALKSASVYDDALLIVQGV